MHFHQLYTNFITIMNNKAKLLHVGLKYFHLNFIFVIHTQMTELKRNFTWWNIKKERCETNLSVNYHSLTST